MVGYNVAVKMLSAQTELTIVVMPHNATWTLVDLLAPRDAVDA